MDPASVMMFLSSIMGSQGQGGGGGQTGMPVDIRPGGAQGGSKMGIGGKFVDLLGGVNKAIQGFDKVRGPATTPGGQAAPAPAPAVLPSSGSTASGGQSPDVQALLAQIFGNGPGARALPPIQPSSGPRMGSLY